MEKFSFPSLTAKAIESQLLEAARQLVKTPTEIGETPPAVDAESKISLEGIEGLLAEAYRKASPSGWRYFHRTLRRQSRMNSLILGMLGELMRILDRLNVPLQKLHERAVSGYQQSIAIQNEARKQAEEAHKQQQALDSLERMVGEVLEKQQEQIRALSRAVQDVQIKSPQYLDEFDQLYLELENKFRGDEETVRERLTVYLPYLEKTKMLFPGMSVLDLGCGRGEWLTLLRENHYQARGVDANRAMVKKCADRGLDVARNDALDYLQNQPGESLAVITAFHLVEHLSFDRLIELLDQILRVLRPGGIAIFETPNPESVLVATRSFYLDPTHQKPLPPNLFQFLIESRGFVSNEILKLQTVSEETQLKSAHAPNLAGAMNALFLGAQDYGIIAQKRS